jgi:nickel superoxide dismutase
MKTTLTVLAMILALSAQTFAHCQIPCGIFDDQARIHEMEEHVTTIKKSMNEITRLSAEETPDYNQIVRWVNNKDEHAEKITEIVTYYFLEQRVKASQAEEKYVAELKVLHAIMVNAMKAKQTVDLEYVEKLNELIHQFEHLYLGEMHTH